MEQTIRKIYFRIFTLQNRIKQLDDERSGPLDAKTANIFLARNASEKDCRLEELTFLNEIINDLVK